MQPARSVRASRSGVGVVALCALIVGGVLAQSGAAYPSTTRAGESIGIGPRIEIESHDGYNGARCFSPTSCVAVGGNNTGVGHPISIHGNPATWGPAQTRVTSLPAAFGSQQERGYLSALACTSVTVCLAVGDDGNTQPFFMKGNPATWTAANAHQVTLPGAFNALGGGFGDLQGISCFAGLTRCTAVGVDGNLQPFELRGDPATWTAADARQITLPASFQGGVLSDINCRTYWSCVAVGETGKGRPLTLHGNPNIVGAGTAWAPSRTETALPASFGHKGQLNSVSCPETIDLCIAVGNSGGGVDEVMSMQGNPATSAWASGADASEVSGAVGFWDAISCTSTTSCVAVGQDVNGAISDQGDPASAAWRTTGADMTAIALLGPWSGSVAALYGVNCVSTFCAAVGEDDTSSYTPLTDYGVPGLPPWSNGADVKHP